MNLNALCDDLKASASRLALRTAEEKNLALLAVASALDARRGEILEANARDVDKARAGGMKESLVARLALSNKGLDEIIDSLKTLSDQTDPLGRVDEGWKVPNGMEIRKVRVPLGVVAVIYESRPNVTVDVFALAYKSSNAVLLRGSSSALESNRALLAAIKAGLAAAGGETGAVALSEPLSEGANTHADVDWILGAVGKIDVVLPRGGASLIRTVVQNARIPVIETGAGVCHEYIDASADADMALRIAENAKIQKPGACNALECLLVHSSRAAEILPRLREIYAPYEPKTGRPGGVELRCDPRALEILASPEAAAGGTFPPNVVPASEEDWGMEYLDYVLAVKVVNSLDEAIDHINRYNTRHSEVIVTDSRESAREFQRRVDAACVYVNASIRFTDGGQFGMGAEVGISTQKLHARGPMGVEALTTIKYLIDGEGQVRP